MSKMSLVDELINIEPHKISRNLSEYITYIYGPPKVGKTTLGSKMPKPLLLAFERGYNAIAGIKPVDITKWAEVKSIAKALDDPRLKEQYATIIIDTVDIAASLCEKYVCNQNSVQKIGEIPYGGGWGLLKKEFEEVFRGIAQKGYAVYFISHYKEGAFTRLDGTEFSTIKPSVTTTYNNIIENMADIYGFMHPVYNTETRTSSVKITLRSIDGSITCGGRFKYIPEEIDGTYEALVDALNKAIDKEAEVNGSEFITSERSEYKIKEYDFNEYKKKANSIIQSLMTNNSKEDFEASFYPIIQDIIHKHLGGKKLNDVVPSQVEQLVQIVEELERL